jgi:hypothetical protein
MSDEPESALTPDEVRVRRLTDLYLEGGLIGGHPARLRARDLARMHARLVELKLDPDALPSAEEYRQAAPWLAAELRGRASEHRQLIALGRSPEGHVALGGADPDRTVWADLSTPENLLTKRLLNAERAILVREHDAQHGRARHYGGNIAAEMLGRDHDEPAYRWGDAAMCPECRWLGLGPWSLFIRERPDQIYCSRDCQRRHGKRVGAARRRARSASK